MKIDKTAYIGFALILAKEVILEKKSIVRNFTICNGIDKLHLQEFGRLGTFNYVTGFLTSTKGYFEHNQGRECILKIGKHSAITSRHFIDCTGGVYLGDFSTFAGIRSQILTHSIDLKLNRQDSNRVVIGDYCFIGTGCVLLKGAKLPSYSVLGALSLLNKNFEEELSVYAGNPARKVKSLNLEEYKYFKREKGIV